MQVLTIHCMYISWNTEEPLYNGHFKAKDFLATFCCNIEVLFFQKFKKVLVTPFGTNIFVPVMEVFLLCP